MLAALDPDSPDVHAEHARLALAPAGITSAPGSLHSAAGPEGHPSPGPARPRRGCPPASEETVRQVQQGEAGPPRH